MNHIGVFGNPLARLFLFSLLSLAGFSLADARATAQETYKTGEGDSVTVNLRVERECIFLGEPVTLKLEIGNGEEQVYEFVYREAKPVVTLLVTGSNGDLIRETLPNATIGCIAPRFERDDTERYFPDDTVFHLFDNIFFKTPGNYRVTLEKPAVLRNRRTSAITEILIRASLNLEVVEKTPARTSAATIEHARRLLEEGPDFGENIGWIEKVHDESAIPFLALILSRHHNAPRREENEEQTELIATLAHVAQAAYVLGTFQDDRALEALRKGMTSPNDLIRRAVGRALWSSKHPKAHSLLLSMWRDPDWGTRDNIVQFLESNPSEEGTRILLELSRDPNEIVRKSAQLALEQLKSRPRP